MDVVDTLYTARKTSRQTLPDAHRRRIHITGRGTVTTGKNGAR